MSEYPVGTVATATVRGVENVRVMFCASHVYPGVFDWMSATTPEGDRWHRSSDLVDIRPFVVLDPEDEPLKTFIDRHSDGKGSGCGMGGAALVKVIQAQTKPPRIPEPGLWGVVEASVGKDGRYKFVRAFEANWMCTADSSVYPWLELIDPTLVREGIES